MDQQIEQKIVERGQEFFNSISGEAPSIFNKGWWTGKVMDWSMKNEDFKVQLFRFVDVLPYLNTSESLLRHIREYFASSGSEVPSVLRWGAGKAGLGGALTAKIMGGAIRSNIESMGRQFIIGQNVKEAMGGLAKLRKDGFAFTVDLLGEASVNEEESDAYAAGYHEVLDALAEEQKKWPALPGNGPDNGMDWGSMPKVNISIKPSALYSRANPVALEDSVEGIYRRLAPLYQKTIDMGGFMCIDMEQLKYREITVELFKRLAFRPGIPPLSASLPCPAGLSEGYGTGRQRSHRLGQKGKAAHRPAAGQGGVLGRGNRAREAVRLARPGVDAQARKRHGP